MGFVLRRLIKNENKRFTIYIILDIILILSLIFFAFNVKSEWNKGYEFCKKQACELCFYITTNETIIPKEANISDLYDKFKKKGT